jgi:hypothetical protein
MLSSSEAFEKFSTWKNSKTWLNVTVIERGQPEHVLSLRIIRLDEGPSLVNVIGRETHTFGEFDVTGAEFSWEPGRMVVSREDIEWLIFEEEETK